MVARFNRSFLDEQFIMMKTHLFKICLVGTLLLVMYSCFHGQSRGSRLKIVIGNVLNPEATLTQRYERCVRASQSGGAFLCYTNGNVILRYLNKGGEVSVMRVDFVEKQEKCTRLEIPSAIDGAQVTEIGEGAFHDQKNLVEIRLPDSVRAIGDFAFIGCTALQRFKAPQALERIDDCLFVGCSNLATVQISEKVSSIGAYAFLGCGALRNFEVDSKNKSLMSKDGVLLTRDGRELIGYPSGKGKKRYAIPSTVKVVRKGAFVDCAHLARVFVPDCVNEIGDWNFYACRRLKSVFMNAGACVKLGRNVPSMLFRYGASRARP